MNSIVPLAKRLIVPITASITAADQREMNRDPWAKSWKYGVGFVYFAVVLLAFTTAIRFFHIWGDKIRVALHRESNPQPVTQHQQSNSEGYSPSSATTDNSTAQFFPQQAARMPVPRREESFISKIVPVNKAIALSRWIFYRPIPTLRIGKLEFVFPSLAVTVIILAALIFVTLYCFLPQPLYFWSIKLGSPPLAIRAGMLAVAMVPWIVALATKANFISMLTGLSAERLNGLHRWSAYLCLFLSLVHTVPFYVTPVWKNPTAYTNYRLLIGTNIYIYGTGVAALVPLLVLCVHSLPFLRHKLYELFIVIHIPVSFIFVAMLFWHTMNFLKSWAYLWITIAIWVVSYIIRLFYLNWTNPFHTKSFMIGEESAVTLLPQNAIKVTIPTRLRWRPGQYVYLRMPGIAFMESHPFTIASLCSDDFPSAYGEKYRDMTLVFRPFHGFTRKVFRKALTGSPYKTYTALLEGPYGGMQREMAAFDDVIFFAGGSGITAIASQLLDLIKKIRDGKAVTKSVRVVWALKTPETMEWFQEELRICRDYAPPNIVNCHFFLTNIKDNRASRDLVQEKIYDMLQGIDKRNSAYIREAAGGDAEREKELRRENEDGLAALPNAYMASHIAPTRQYFQQPQFQEAQIQQAQFQQLQFQQSQFQQAQFQQFRQPAIPQAYYPQPEPQVSSPGYIPPSPNNGAQVPFDFGFAAQPSPYAAPPAQPSPQRTPPRFAYLQPSQRRENWRTDYFRPNIPEMLNEFSNSFGRRACVFVCGPPSMRVQVANTVAKLQLKVLADSSKDEIFLHAENYNI
ncbi:hypothetical protein N7474_002361 [Penicillium riverlandense]|uniref:uncharacterized protein n=1 Tax=Penicillium riverlandense TaxID=1903569 RepID=UPI0025488702|nr:uncharacterized protein N7474_002361 [Penicillium riverlandense]KAJ5825223.1 hypothetical protein N7474_002361 [Penicillium riverlandense]